MHEIKLIEIRVYRCNEIQINLLFVGPKGLPKQDAVVSDRAIFSAVNDMATSHTKRYLCERSSVEIVFIGGFSQ